MLHREPTILDRQDKQPFYERATRLAKRATLGGAAIFILDYAGLMVELVRNVSTSDKLLEASINILRGSVVLSVGSLATYGYYAYQEQHNPRKLEIDQARLWQEIAESPDAAVLAARFDEIAPLGPPSQDLG